MPARDLQSSPRHFSIRSHCRKFNLALTPYAEPSQRLFRMKCDGRHPYSGVVSTPQRSRVDTVGFPGFSEPMFLHVGCARHGEFIGSLCGSWCLSKQVQESSGKTGDDYIEIKVTLPGVCLQGPWRRNVGPWFMTRILHRYGNIYYIDKHRYYM